MQITIKYSTSSALLFFLQFSVVLHLLPGGMTMQSTKFSMGSKEGRGDTSVWTDTSSDRAQKAKMKHVPSSILECFGRKIMLLLYLCSFPCSNFIFWFLW